MSDKHVKVSVPINIGGQRNENLFAYPTDKPDHFKINSIPFFAYGINDGDIVRCDKSGTVLEVVEASGFWTFRVRFQPGTDMDAMNKVARHLHEELGAGLNLGYPGFMSIDIGPDKDHDALVAYLDELEGQERIQYESAAQRAQGSFSDPAQQG
jgi:hypothetical protein